MRDHRPRVLFMGTPGFAVGVLSGLLEAGVNVVRVVTVPDRPAGRGLQAKASEVKLFAQQRGLPLLQPERLTDGEFLAALQGDAIDIGVVVAFRKLPRAVVELPSIGFFNVHASLLPQLRGAAPINWALIHGMPCSGVTTFLLNDAIDCGAILLQSSVALSSSTTAGELHDMLMETGSELAVRTVRGLSDGTLTAMEQPTQGDLLPAPKIFRADCLLDFRRSALELHNLCRGLSPRPGAWCYLHREGQAAKSVKLFATGVPAVEDPMTGLSLEEGVVGSALAQEGAQYLDILCGGGSWLRVGEIQPEGKRRMPVKDFLLGAGSGRFFFSNEAK